MDDRLAHFITLVGNACNDARSAGVEVEVELDSGQRAQGVPDPQPAEDPSREADESGWSRDLLIDGVSVDLERVVAVRVMRPQPGAASA